MGRDVGRVKRRNETDKEEIGGNGKKRVRERIRI